MSLKYVPQRGDLVWLEFDPPAGHEQLGRRPALVISHGRYNEKVGLALVCPVTSKSKNYAFEVLIEKPSIRGSVLADQVKSLDWNTRNAEFIARVDDTELDAVVERVEALIR